MTKNRLTKTLYASALTLLAVVSVAIVPAAAQAHEIKPGNAEIDASGTDFTSQIEGLFPITCTSDTMTFQTTPAGQASYKLKFHLANCNNSETWTATEPSITATGSNTGALKFAALVATISGVCTITIAHPTIPFTTETGIAPPLEPSSLTINNVTVSASNTCGGPPKITLSGHYALFDLTTIASPVSFS